MRLLLLLWPVFHALPVDHPSYRTHSYLHVTELHCQYQNSNDGKNIGLSRFRYQDNKFLNLNPTNESAVYT